jgi:hypothetical protein
VGYIGDRDELPLRKPQPVEQSREAGQRLGPFGDRLRLEVLQDLDVVLNSEEAILQGLKLACTFEEGP